MGIELSLIKTEETRTDCVYAFGSSNETIGRVRLHKRSGDIELLNTPEMDGGGTERYYLAHAVPRLQSYHDRTEYPPRDHWNV